MSRQLALALVALLGLLASTCTSGDDAAPSPSSAAPEATPIPRGTSIATTTQSPTPTLSATAQPTPASTPSATDTTETQATPTPGATYVGRLPEEPTRLSGGIEPLSPDTRTGIPGIDRVIEALVSSDVETLLSLVEWREIECSLTGGPLPSPPACPLGSPSGTPVRAVSFSDNGEGAHKTPDEVRIALRTTFDSGAELCWIAETRVWDGASEYGIKLRALVIQGQTYLSKDTDFHVDGRGRITRLGAAIEPYSSVPVCG